MQMFPIENVAKLTLILITVLSTREFISNVDAEEPLRSYVSFPRLAWSSLKTVGHIGSKKLKKAEDYIDYYCLDGDSDEFWKPFNINSPEIKLYQKEYGVKFLNIIMHGWNNDFHPYFFVANEEWTKLAPRVWNQNEPNSVTCIAVWSKIAHYDYLYTAMKQHMSEIANGIKKFIKQLYLVHSNIFAEKISFAGHSLANFVLIKACNELFDENETGTKFRFMYGLDAAGPTFQKSEPKDDEKKLYYNLNKKAVDFSVFMHTEGIFFGVRRPLGHADYYIYWGRNQPGCTGAIRTVCDHLKTLSYFIASLFRENKFMGNRCQTANKKELKTCVEKPESEQELMGIYNDHLDTREGIFCINKLTVDFPHCIGCTGKPTPMPKPKSKPFKLF